MSYTTEHEIPCPQSETHLQAEVAQIYLNDLLWQIDNLTIPHEQAVEIMRDIEHAAEIIQAAVEAIQPGKPCDVDACDWKPAST